jgi:hypothetical protein
MSRNPILPHHDNVEHVIAGDRRENIGHAEARIRVYALRMSSAVSVEIAVALFLESKSASY